MERSPDPPHGAGPVRLPPFVEERARRAGAAGAAWLAGLPDLVGERAAEDKAGRLAALVADLWERHGRPCPERVVQRALDYAGQRAAGADRLVVGPGRSRRGRAVPGHRCPAGRLSAHGPLDSVAEDDRSVHDVRGIHMRMTRFAVLPAAFALLAGTATTAHAAEPGAEPVTEFRFTADPGAHPLGGRSGVWATPDREVRVLENRNVIRIDSATWENREQFLLELSTPDGSPLGLGAHQQGQAPETLRTLVVYNGLGCTEARAAAVVDRLERDAEGALTALDVTLEHYCAGSGDKGLHAQVRYRA